MERVIEELIQRTKDGEVGWNRPTGAGGFEAEVEGKCVRIYRNGTISIKGWKYQSDAGVDLYDAVREKKRPEFVDEFIDSVVSSS